ncbi:MAG: DUF1080 domain-containing protein [Lacunisphaera sp.]|nr:DUF1080 domain-containing protein [Lacunisphaera sp.]
MWLSPLLAATPFNVRDFGATGDGVTKDTRAFQKALDACAVAGGGDVIVPAGRYLIGSIQLGTRTTLRLEQDSILTGSPDLDDYPIIDVRWEGRTLPGHRALIYAANVDHIGITGPGLIEGNPATAASNRPPRGTVVLEPINCTNILWEGFTVKQPGNNWATHPTYCDDIVIRNVTIEGGRDGIDLDSCRRVRIEGCTINTGDDCISLKSGRGMDGARLGRPTEDVLITNCKMTGRRFACIGIGSEISGGVRNIRIEHCSFRAYTHAIYLKTRIGRGGVNENISADDIDVLGGDFLRINLVKGGNTNTADDPVEGLPGYPVARRLAFSNIRLQGAKAVVVGTEVSALRPVESLVLTNITGTCSAGLTLANMKDVVLKDINVTGFTGALLGTVNVTGTGLEGAQAIPAPVDPAPGNAPGAARAVRTALWNGKDLSGWKFFLNDATIEPTTVWSVQDGALRLATKASGYIKTEKDYSNYHLHVEWRWDKDAAANANSGVMVHVHGPDLVWPLCFECQLKTGNAGQVVGMGLDIPDAPLQANRKRAPKLADSSEKPLGEWNTYEIFCRRDTVEVFVNGVRQNHVTSLPVSAGAIALQMEGCPIEFRNVWLEPL